MPPRPLASPSQRLGLLAAGLLLVSSLAHGQIVHEKPGSIKAANRRALREAKHTESPYKDSHLDVTRDQLKRGQSNPAQTETDKAVDYKKGVAPNAQQPGSPGRRHKKKKP